MLEGVFLERLHRFGARVQVRAREEYCHVPNSGRLRELLYPGARVALLDHFKPPAKNFKKSAVRKTRYSIQLAYYRKKWVCVEANLAPRLLKEAWEKGKISLLRYYDELKAEVPLNIHTRFDFLAIRRSTGERAWVEVKCVTLVDEKGVARFPDAPSSRASKHLRELMGLARKPRTKAFIIFVVQNPYALAVGPKEDTDPLFAQTLREASRQGVFLAAYLARITSREASILRPLKIVLD
jgi:sugar fermentation stimulation protein A